MGSSASPDSLRPLSGSLQGNEDGRCDDVTCIKAGRFKVSCYLCYRVYHSGCGGLPDSDFQQIRCCESVPGPDGFTRVANQNKVRCCLCGRHFFKMYARMTDFDTYTCVPCIMNTTPTEESPPKKKPKHS